MPVRVVHHPSVDAFLAAAEPFLAAREAEHNLLFGISSTVRANPDILTEGPAHFATVTDAGDRTVAATLRTPPWNQVLSCIDDFEAITALVDALRDDSLPGVLGPAYEASRFAAAWTDATGRPAHLQLAERIFRLERVTPPARPASGSWRPVESGDVGLVAQWLVDFNAEAMPESPRLTDPTATAARWVLDVGRFGYAWVDRGGIVSLVGASGETPNGIRIGPVYTPPEARGRGYATSLTAAASADQLARGRRFVFLFADLANPTANRIYQAIGFEPVCEVRQFRFGDPGG